MQINFLFKCCLLKLIVFIVNISSTIIFNNWCFYFILFFQSSFFAMGDVTMENSFSSMLNFFVFSSSYSLMYFFLELNPSTDIKPTIIHTQGEERCMHWIIRMKEMLEELSRLLFCVAPICGGWWLMSNCLF